MTEQSNYKGKHYLKLSNLIPLVIILTGITAVSLSLLGEIKLTIPEGIIISLLSLLAFDALTERLSILWRIEKHVKETSIPQFIKSRTEIKPFSEYAQNASEICIAAVSAIAICPQNINFFVEKLKNGCNIKIVLLNPESHSIETLHIQYGIPTAKTGIEASLECLKGIFETQKFKGKFEVQLLDVFLPISIVAIDLENNTGSILVEFHSYKKTVDERPHIIISAKDNPQWFNSYREQFKQAWSDSIPWEPKENKNIR
jgi:hypothetical protein